VFAGLYSVVFDDLASIDPIATFSFLRPWKISGIRMNARGVPITATRR